MRDEDLLTPGAITQILNDEKPHNPVLQIIGYKLISTDQMAFGQSDEKRFRLMMGDGKRAHQYCIITNQDLVNDLHLKKIQKWSIVRVTSYQTVDYGDGPDKRLLIYILNMEVIKDGNLVGTKIVVGQPDGAPNQPAPAVTSGPDMSRPNYGAPTNESPRPAFQPTGNNYNSDLTQPQPYAARGGAGGISLGGGIQRNVIESPRRVHASYEHQTIGIGELTPYIGKWNIKGRVISKGGIREYNNAKGGGKLFNFTMVDKTGEIKVTAFNQDCDRVYPYVEPNKIYILGRASVKNADKRYSSSDFEVTLNSDSLLEEVPDSREADDIPMGKFNFVSIATLGNLTPPARVDLIGAVTQVSEASTIMSKNKNKELKKRNVTIVDQSRHTIGLTIWGERAETFNGAVGDVLVSKDAQVSSYGGRSASAGDVLFINPEIPEARKMRNWYSNLIDSNFTSLTATQESGGTSDQYKLLDEMKNMSIVRQITSTGQTSGQYAKCKAFVLSIGKNPVYKCCPKEGCGKKLVDMQNGEMKCDKCQQTYSNYNIRFKTDVEISDNVETCWVTLWDEKAENLLKIKPEALERLMRMDNKDLYEKIITKPNFRMFNFTLRSRIETYQQEERVKVHVMNMADVDPVSYCKQLTSEIKAFAARRAMA